MEDDKMQVNLAHLLNLPCLQKLTPEDWLKLIQEKKCFHCRRGHMASSKECPARSENLAKPSPAQWWENWDK
jgi:hypothetical protein